jgi:hypothetical protein
MKISDTELLILTQSYEALGNKMSINQSWVLSALKELNAWRELTRPTHATHHEIIESIRDGKF